MGKDAEKQPIVPVKKANALIRCVGKPSLNSNKVLLAALLHVEEKKGSAREKRELSEKVGINFAKGLVAEISNSELRSAMGKTTGGNYYEDIVKTLMDPSSPNALSKQWGIFIQDPGSKLYGYASIVTSVAYDGKKGKLYVKFSDEPIVRSYIMDVKRNYTTLSYHTMMRIKNNSTYRAYELIMSEIGMIDYKHGRIKRQNYNVEFGLSELKCKLGILDPFCHSDIRAAFSEAKTREDFEKIEYRIAMQTGKVNEYSNFKRKILDKVKQEINSMENSEFRIDYIPHKTGKKVTSIEFLVTRTEQIEEIVDEKKPDAEVDPMAQIEEILTVQSIIEERLSAKDIISILDAAGHDIEKIRTAYKVACDSTAEINNLTGFLIKAITEGYTEGVKKRGRKKNKFINFEQSEVDYDEIAKKKVAKKMKGQ